MIAPQELRLGNYLQDREDNLCQVVELGKDSIYAPVIGKAGTKLPNKPIELTEEWFQKFGFICLGKKRNWFDYVLNSRVMISISLEGNLSIMVCGEFSNVRNDFRYVHQLQNLTFYLTGEELTIK